jgi:hypothetical protein
MVKLLQIFDAFWAKSFGVQQQKYEIINKQWFRQNISEKFQPGLAGCRVPIPAAFLCVLHCTC